MNVVECFHVGTVASKRHNEDSVSFFFFVRSLLRLFVCFWDTSRDPIDKISLDCPRTDEHDIIMNLEYCIMLYAKQQL